MACRTRLDNGTPFTGKPRRRSVPTRTGGRLAVEMETSALFATAAFRRVAVTSLLVVSDELSSLAWRPGFKDPRFCRGRLAARQAVARLMASIP